MVISRKYAYFSTAFHEDDKAGKKREGTEVGGSGVESESEENPSGAADELLPLPRVSERERRSHLLKAKTKQKTTNKS